VRVYRFRSRRQPTFPHAQGRTASSWRDWLPLRLPPGSNDGRSKTVGAVIADGASRAHGDVDKRSPALELVLADSVEEIGSPDRSCRAGGFNGDEEWPVVHDVVVEKAFAAAMSPKMASGIKVQRASRAYA